VKLRQNQKGSHTMDHDHHNAMPDITEGADTSRICSEICQMKLKEDPWFYATGGSAERPKVVPERI